MKISGPALRCLGPSFLLGINKGRIGSYIPSLDSELIDILNIFRNGEEPLF